MEETTKKVIKLESEVEYLKKRMENVEAENRQVKDTLNIYQASSIQVKNKLDQIYNALIGDDMGNTGIVKRTHVIENWITSIKTKQAWVFGAMAAAVALGRLLSWGGEQLLKFIK